MLYHQIINLSYMMGATSGVWTVCSSRALYKETTYTASSASFLDLYLEFDDSGQLNI
jgi:hypothetical protein